MIYCDLKGGLGNILFQIATTKSLSIDNNTDYSLNNLISHLKFLDSDNIHNPNLKHSFEYLKLFKGLNHTPIKSKIKVLTFPFEFIEVDQINEDVLIDGFFQSEKYFKHNRNHILDMFVFDFKLDKKYDFLEEKKTTSIHVRRGDYVNQPNHHPVQTLNYYLDSIDMLKDDTDLFIVFSDDINWCKENLKLDNIIYIENEKDYIELYLMSICTNHIISNSSFSWWGAWLNRNENKKVIGPLRWFGDAIKHNTGDVLPENWIKI